MYDRNFKCISAFIYVVLYFTENQLYAPALKGVIDFLPPLYDPACGTGGMLSIAEEYVNSLNQKATLKVYGQEINPESYAICKSDMLIKGQDPRKIKFGNTFTDDGLEADHFDYMLSNPPFGVDWKKAKNTIKKEHENKGLSGRFGVGLPRINDGSLLFLQHMISKMKPDGSRIAIVFNGSPLFSGAAGSGESNIRQWLFENDWLEAIVALPDQLFYNTGISTYIWIVSNKKSSERQGKVQLINATGNKDEELVKEGKLDFNRFWAKMDRSLGNKRKKIAENGTEKGIGFISNIYGDFENTEFSKIYPNEFFGYWRVTIEQPSWRELNEKLTDDKTRLIQLMDDGNETEIDKMIKETKKSVLANLKSGKWKLAGNTITKDDGGSIKLKAAAHKRDVENIPFLKKDENGNLISQNIEEYYKREVEPHLELSWIDHNKTKIGYTINFTKYFYEFKSLRPLEEIKADIMALEEKVFEKEQHILE